MNKKIESGIYKVNVVKMELKGSKNGDPMVSIWFKVVPQGKYTNKLIFMNQVITEGYQIHIVNELLRSLTENLTDVDIEFINYPQYSKLLDDVVKKIRNNFIYLLEYKQNAKGYKLFKIVKTFNVKEKGSSLDVKIAK